MDLKVSQLLDHTTQFTLVDRPGCVSIKIVVKIGVISDIQADDVLPMASSATGQANVRGEMGASDDASGRSQDGALSARGPLQLQSAGVTSWSGINCLFCLSEALNFSNHEACVGC